MPETAIALYLDLLKRCVANLIYGDAAIRRIEEEPDEEAIRPYSAERRQDGTDYPSQAHTMIGLPRLDNIQALVEDILRSGTPGDLIETGAWRGGSTIFMRGILKAYGVTDRTVWVADSFGTLPRTAEHGMSERSFTSFGSDAFRTGWTESALPAKVQDRLDLVMAGTSYEEVRERFGRYGLLDDQVRFLPGWFNETLPGAPIDRLALLRLDGDFYDSTYVALEELYPRLSTGGYVIVDDYGSFEECKQAVHDYLGKIGLEPDIERVNEVAVYWQKRD